MGFADGSLPFLGRDYIPHRAAVRWRVVDVVNRVGWVLVDQCEVWDASHGVLTTAGPLLLTF